MSQESHIFSSLATYFNRIKNTRQTTLLGIRYVDKFLTNTLLEKDLEFDNIWIWYKKQDFNMNKTKQLMNLIPGDNPRKMEETHP